MTLWRDETFFALCGIVATYRDWLRNGVTSEGKSPSMKYAEMYAKACRVLRANGISPDEAEKLHLKRIKKIRE